MSETAGNREIIYLDNSATTMVCREAADKAYAAMTESYGNPSSRHLLGIAAADLLREARQNVADALHSRPEEILFTSCGTEADNIAFFGAANAFKHRGNRIVTTAIEHPAVLKAASELENRGFDVVRLRPGRDGIIKPEDLFAAVNEKTVLVSIMLVNNETGAVQPVEAAREAVRRANAPALVHCDAVQAFCRTDVDPRKLGVDLLTVSSHKIHGPKGAAALFIKNGVRIPPMMFGGGQENGMRPGTEALPALAGFGEAARVAAASLTQNAALAARLKARLVDGAKEIPGAVVNSPEDGCPYVVNLSVPGIRSEVMLNALSAKAICVSSGSACSKGAKSSVLAAMDLPRAAADSAIRVSFSRYNTQEDVEKLLREMKNAADTLLKASV